MNKIIIGLGVIALIIGLRVCVHTTVDMKDDLSYVKTEVSVLKNRLKAMESMQDMHVQGYH